MNDVFISINLAYPLLINHVFYNQASLTLSGCGWNLTSYQSWSVYKGNLLLFDDHSDQVEECLNNLIGYSIRYTESNVLEALDEREQTIYLDNNMVIIFRGDEEFYMGS